MLQNTQKLNKSQIFTRSQGIWEQQRESLARSVCVFPYILPFLPFLVYQYLLKPFS